MTKRKSHGSVDDELKRLSAMDEAEINLSDIPEVTDWSDAVVGRFYRPRKERVTLRLDADVLAWFKLQGRGYQTRMNAVLREEMERKRKIKHARQRQKPASGKANAHATGAGS